MPRRGFTLLEMLVATLVFTFGFVAVYGMFLVGMRHRVLADATTRCATVAQSLIAEMRLRAAIRPGTMPPAAVAFEGDGDPDGGAESGTFFAYPDQPGIYYRVHEAEGIPDADGDGIRVTLLVGMLEGTGETLAADAVARRFQLPSDDPATWDRLLERGVLQRYRAALHRRIDW